MIWMLFGGSLLLAIMLIRFTYGVEKKRQDRDRQEVAKQMKEFSEALKKAGTKK
jgi:hypothetical protein